jgi:signal transduction histidine kinase/CheY-like chemotaxis protein
LPATETLPEPLIWFARQLPWCVAVYDAVGKCLLANDALLRWLRREERTVQGRSLFELWPAPVAAREAADLDLVLNGDRIEQVEMRSLAGGDSDSSRAVRVVKFPWAAATGRVAGMVVVFVEHHHRAETAGSLAQPETVGRLALGIIHDFNNALALLRGQVSLLEHSFAGQPEQRSQLESLSQILDHACALPQQLLRFIRNEPLSRQRLDVNTLLSSLEGLLRPRLGPDRTLEYRLTPGGAWIEGDPVQLMQAFLNLAGNALQAMPEGGHLVMETRLVRLSAQENTRTPGESGTFIRVTIQDSGEGIAQEVLPRIFEPLFTTRAGRGSGLGLAIVNEVVQRHFGWVTCQSNREEGTRFVLHLPAAPRANEGSARAGGRAPTVLVLERDPDIRQLTAMILEQGPFHAESAGSLAEAQERLQEEGAIDVLLVGGDLCSGSDGVALGELLQQWPRTRLLVTTSGQPPVLPASCAGALRGLIHKPYSADLLLRAVQTALWATPAG